MSDRLDVAAVTARAAKAAGIAPEFLAGYVEMLNTVSTTGCRLARGELESRRALGARAADDAVVALADGYDEAQRLMLRQEEAARREFIDDLFYGRSDLCRRAHVSRTATPRERRRGGPAALSERAGVDLPARPDQEAHRLRPP